jgi:multidrug efflux pump subunit AcrB
MVYSQERTLTTTVDNVEHIESTSYDSIGVIKIYFQPGTNPSTAVAQLTAVSQTILKQLPPGTTPPLVLQYSASTVPILQFAISSTNLSEQEVFDIALNQIRVGLVSVAGVGRSLIPSGASKKWFRSTLTQRLSKQTTWPN